MVNDCRIGPALTALVLLLFAHSLWAAQISMRSDRNPVSLSESFQVVFEADAGVDDEPDFSPLERDFQIISTSQSSSISIINGKASSTKTWNLTVLARRTGRLEIPAIAFGRDRSQPGAVDVTLGAAPPPGKQAVESGEVFLEVEAQPLQPYVQQQIVYKVRLFRAFPTANATLSEPEVEQGDAIKERIGEDALYDTRVNGRPYQVVERRYAVYPQSSGVLKIGPLTFRGQTGLSPFSMLDPFGRRPEMIVRQSAPVELEVRPKPEGQDMNTWLPARSLTLAQSWSGDPPTFRRADNAHIDVNRGRPHRQPVAGTAAVGACDIQVLSGPGAVDRCQIRQRHGRHAHRKGGHHSQSAGGVRVARCSHPVVEHPARSIGVCRAPGAAHRRAFVGWGGRHTGSSGAIRIRRRAVHHTRLGAAGNRNGRCRNPG